MTTTTEPRIYCHDCKAVILRRADFLQCICGIGFVAQWDVSEGNGVFWGRIQFPETKEVTK